MLIQRTLPNSVSATSTIASLQHHTAISLKQSEKGAFAPCLTPGNKGPGGYYSNRASSPVLGEVKGNPWFPTARSTCC